MKKNMILSLLLVILGFMGACKDELIQKDLQDEVLSSTSVSMIDPSTPDGVQPFIIPSSGEGSIIKSAPSAEYNLIFSDEFNSGSLDLTKWTKNMPTHVGSYNGQAHNHQAWLAPENVWVDANGKLVIQATDQRHPDAPYSVTHNSNEYPLEYQAGAIHTYGKFALTYGYIEGHFKSSGNIGTWPAFWTLNSDKSWPPEIDILEIPISSASERQVQHYYYHYGADWTQHKSFGNHRDHNVNLNEAYHTYGVEWGPDYMKFFFDGNQIGSWSNRPECAEGQDMYLLINLAVGGWPGTPPSGQTWPDFYTCDWVRVYQLGSPGNAAPVFTSGTAPTSGTTGVEYSHTFTASDADQDDLTFVGETVPSWLTFDPATAVLSGTPTATGTYPVVISVTDGTDTIEQSYSIVVSEPVEPGGNYVLNGDFETGSLSPEWNSWNNAITSTDVYAGTYAGKINSGAGSIQQTVTGLTPNTEYEFKVYAKLSSVSDIAVALVKDYDGTAQQSVSITSTGYQQYTISFTTGTTNTSALVSVYNSAGGVVYADNYEVREAGVTPPPASAQMHVSAINFDKRKAGKNYYVFGNVVVKDENGQVVPGATVDVTWSGAVSGSASAVTDSNGLVSIKSDRVSGGGTFALTVDNITKAGNTYDSAANVETSDSIVHP
ncbi:glycosyl hydrolase family protein [Labilibacter sediminis]|nr:glycosyl hydrolase family protein [Labilibacter sediminis]